MAMICIPVSVIGLSVFTADLKVNRSLFEYQTIGLNTSL
ncbi:hypothetical protein SPWS13_2943 [Shewanella putrefaciens]|nr:hypothetical protein SPWS13_2943 [Shewanella putrefaciens]